MIVMHTFHMSTLDLSLENTFCHLHHSNCNFQENHLFLEQDLEQKELIRAQNDY